MATFSRTKRTEDCSGMWPLAEVRAGFDRYTPESRTESVGARTGDFDPERTFLSTLRDRLAMASVLVSKISMPRSKCRGSLKWLS